MSGRIVNAKDVLKQMAAIVRPLVRLCIRAGVTYPALSELLKEVYVHVADQEFSLPDKGQTDSRLSVITGVHRREVKRLRAHAMPQDLISESASLSSLLIAKWLADPAFALPDGSPRPLMRSGDPSGYAGFDDLVSSVTKDIRPRAIFDDWVDRGIVRLAEDSRIHLSTEVYGPKSNDEEKLYYFGRNLRDHIEASVSNVMTTSATPFFERAVHYDSLSESESADLIQKSNAAAMTILKQVNAQAHEIVSHDEHDGDWRFTLGVYVFRERRRE